jgi:hypothetical protein
MSSACFFEILRNSLSFGLNVNFFSLDLLEKVFHLSKKNKIKIAMHEDKKEKTEMFLVRRSIWK